MLYHVMGDEVECYLSYIGLGLGLYDYYDYYTGYIAFEDVTVGLRDVSG